MTGLQPSAERRRGRGLPRCVEAASTGDAVREGVPRVAARIPLSRRARRAHVSIGSWEDAGPTARQASEESLRDDVVDLARRYEWRVYFTWKSQHSPEGFPDLVLVRGETLIFWELKRDVGPRGGTSHAALTPAQEAWLEDLGRVRRIHSGVIRPRDLEVVAKILCDAPRGASALYERCRTECPGCGSHSRGFVK